jgi:hypothetical protein
MKLPSLLTQLVRYWLCGRRSNERPQDTVPPPPHHTKYSTPKAVVSLRGKVAIVPTLGSTGCGTEILPGREKQVGKQLLISSQGK